VGDQGLETVVRMREGAIHSDPTACRRTIRMRGRALSVVRGSAGLGAYSGSKARRLIKTEVEELPIKGHAMVSNHPRRISGLPSTPS